MTVPTRVRVYVPATLTTLAVLAKTGALDAQLATAVTPGLREALPGLDEEELEWEALLDAAELSLELLAADPGAPRRRVVVAADVPADRLTPVPEAGLGAVRVRDLIDRDQVASLHVDEEPAQPRVAVGDVEGIDLLWYAPQELPEVLAGGSTIG